MAVQTELSADAVAVLRFEIKGWRAKNKESRLPAYHELAAAGIMQPVPGSETEYRFTEEGMKQREEILRNAEDRIERERFEPPDIGNLSEASWACCGRSFRVSVSRSRRGTDRRSANWLRPGSSI